MNKLQIERRLRRLEEKIGLKNSLKESVQSLETGGYEDDAYLELIVYPLYKFWGIKDPGFSHNEFEDFLLESEISSTELSFVIDVQKFVKLVTEYFVNEGLIGSEFLTMKPPKFSIKTRRNVPSFGNVAVTNRNYNALTRQIEKLSNWIKLLRFGFYRSGNGDLLKGLKGSGSESYIHVYTIPKGFGKYEIIMRAVVRNSSKDRIVFYSKNIDDTNDKLKKLLELAKQWEIEYTNNL